MVKRDYYFTRSDNVKLFISYSDAGKKLAQHPTGNVYDSAIDVENAPYTYTETNEPVEEPIDPEYHEPDIPAQDALDVIFGGTE